LDSGKESSSWFDVADLAAGEYFIVVSGESTDPVDYWVNVSAYDYVEPSFPVVEPRADDADVIGDDATVLDVSSGYAWTDGLIDAEGDKDVYAFELAEADQVFVSGYAYRMDGTGFQVGLFDADGNEVAIDPESFSGFFELAAGKYFLVVSDAATEPVGYSLSVSTDETIFTTQGELLPGLDPKTPGSGDGSSGKDDSDGVGIEVVMFNASAPTDVNGDSRQTPLDVLIVISWLNEFGISTVADVRSEMSSRGESVENRYVDINNDGQISPLDALLVINQLNKNSSQSQSAELLGEGEGEDAAEVFAVSADWLFSQSDDESELWGAVELS
jgi:hypothetical protein